MFSMLTLLHALHTYLTLTKINKYLHMMINHLCFFFRSLIFLGWLFVTYGIDLIFIPMYYILVSYRRQICGIESSLVSES